MDTIIKTQRIYIVKVLLEAKLTIWQTCISYLVGDLAALSKYFASLAYNIAVGKQRRVFESTPGCLLAQCSF